MKIIRDSKYKLFEDAQRLSTRAHVAYRWMAEFDWLLAPIWCHILDGTYTVDQARERMRHRLKEFMKDKK